MAGTSGRQYGFQDFALGSPKEASLDEDDYDQQDRYTITAVSTVGPFPRCSMTIMSLMLALTLLNWTNDLLACETSPLNIPVRLRS